jgi:hypothetical protein
VRLFFVIFRSCETPLRLRYPQASYLDTYLDSYFDENQRQAFFNSPSSFDRAAFMATMTDVINENKKNENKFSLVVCKETVLMHYLVMYFSRNFYLVDSINRKISSFLSSGIMSHLIEKYVDLRYWNVKSVKKGPQKLTIEHLRGTFNLWIIVNVISILIFLMEVLLMKLHEVEQRMRNEMQRFLPIT